MDISKKYVLMSEKAEEIQSQKKVKSDDKLLFCFKNGDYFYTDEGIEIVGTTIYESSRYIQHKNKFQIEQVGYEQGDNYFTEKLVWLPRQDQIQSMFINDLTEYSKMNNFVSWFNSNIQDKNKDYSLEMLWLMYYMYLHHNKQWSFDDDTGFWMTK